MSKQHCPEGAKGTAAPTADFADKEPDFSLLCYLQIWLRSPY